MKTNSSRYFPAMNEIFRKHMAALHILFVKFSVPMEGEAGVGPVCKVLICKVLIVKIALCEAV